jgi:hypothetical protein
MVSLIYATPAWSLTLCTVVPVSHGEIEPESQTSSANVAALEKNSFNFLEWAFLLFVRPVLKNAPQIC